MLIYINIIDVIFKRMFLNPSFFVYDIRNGLELCQGKIVYIFLTGLGNMGNVSVLVTSTFSSGGGVLKNSVFLSFTLIHLAL